MTRKQAEQIIREWQDRLGLERWRIEIRWEEKPEVEGANATVWRSAFYEDATLRFNPAWSTWPMERFEQTLVHELLHLCHRGVDETWNDLHGQLHRDAWTVASAWYKQEMEGFIDRLAHRLVEITG